MENNNVVVSQTSVAHDIAVLLSNSKHRRINVLVVVEQDRTLADEIAQWLKKMEQRAIDVVSVVKQNNVFLIDQSLIKSVQSRNVIVVQDTVTPESGIEKIIQAVRDLKGIVLGICSVSNLGLPENVETPVFSLSG